MSQSPPSSPPSNGRDVGRMPPHALEVERAVLGATLIDQRAVGRAIELLDERYFYHAAHSKIFQAIVALYERNEPVDQLTLGEELKRRGQLQEVGDVVYLATLASEVATAANIDHHAKIVLEKALQRALIETSSAVAERAYEGATEIQELIDWTEQRIFSISERRLSGGFEPIDSVLHDTFEYLEQANNRSSSVSGVDTGYADMNDMTSGFQSGDLIILAARPSVGKTALALCLARNAAVEAGVGVAIMSLEMSKQQVAQRLLCIETRVDLHKMRSGRLREDDWMHLTRNVNRLAQAPIYIDDTPGISALEARAKARRLKREHGIGLVIIDYLQLMSSHERVSSREQEVSQISRGMKGLAKELDVPVLALSQLSRATESRTDRRPQLSDLRESGSLEQDADVVMFIYRSDYYGDKVEDQPTMEGVAEIIIGKQRNGPTGSVRLMWNAGCASFENLAPEFRIEQESEFTTP
jgi:replicative DNA helicase